VGPVCYQDSGSPHTYHLPYTHVDTLIRTPAYLKAVRDLDMLDEYSLNWAGRSACIVDRDDYRAIITAVYQLAIVQHPDLINIRPTPQAIFCIMYRHLASRLRVTTPELPDAELKIILNTIFYNSCFKRPGTMYRTAGTSAATRDANRYSSIRGEFVKG
jgi:hypothetical protein